MKISIGQLATAVEEYKNIKLQHNQEIDIADLGCYIDTPTGSSRINHIIKKENLSGIKLVTSTGIEIKCATKHILRQNGRDVFAFDLCVGEKIETINGDVTIDAIYEIPDTTFYDIGIDSPHLYYDMDGVIHHNTIMTAALSDAVSKYGRSIVIVPNKSLVTQTEKDYINMELDVGVYFGDRKEYGRSHTICTWQSLNNLMKNTKNGVGDCTIQEFLTDVVCVIVDECFSADSRVLTPTGYVPIRDIKSGDKVINYSETTKEFKIDIVVKQHVNLAKSSSEKMYELEFDNGNKILVTGNHKFLTDTGWVRADELTNAHEIINKT